MAAPALSNRTGSAGSLGNSPTTAAGRLPSAGPDLDFRSAARMEDLNRLIQEFSKHDQREYDDQRALEIHTAKDFIFSMLGAELSFSLSLTHAHAHQAGRGSGEAQVRPAPVVCSRFFVLTVTATASNR